MFNNEALDVVIGIVLIYLLYSMLVTLVGEYVATKLGMRARILRIAVERMLNDGYYQQTTAKKGKPRAQNFLLRNFLYEPPAFTSSFAGRFYEYPAIKFLSRVETENSTWFSLTKPSYFSADYFADTLINMLKDKSDGDAAMDRIGYTLKYNTQHIQPQTLRIFNNFYSNSGGDPGVFKASLVKWFNETMDRSTGWYKRKLQLVLLILGFLIAGLFNVDSIRIVRILSKDKEARSQLVTMGIQLRNDSAKLKSSLTARADSIRAISVIDTGLSGVTKDIKAANLILGMGWQMDTLTTEESSNLKLSDKPLYADAADIAKGFGELQRDQVVQAKKMRAEKDTLAMVRQEIVKTSLDSLLFSNAKNIDSSKKAKDKLALLRNRVTIKKVAAEKDSFAMVFNGAMLEKLQKPLLKNDLISVTSISAPDKYQTIVLTGKRHYYWYEKVWEFIKNLVRYFPGLFITALALSMGAPFWFNLLNKLVSIRASGAKPDDKKVAGNKSPAPGGPSVPGVPVGPVPVPVGPQPDPAVTALNSLTGKLKSEQGIVSVGLDAKPQVLSVMVLSNTVIAYLVGKYGNTFPLSATATIPVVYAVSGPNKLHASVCGGRIANISRALGSGTLGAYLKKSTDNQTYFISCWHVMADSTNLQASIDPNSASIIDSTPAGGNPVIGTVVDGALGPNFDTGIAVNTIPGFVPSNKNGAFAIKKQYRAVDAYDEAVGTPVIISGMVSGVVNANIYKYLVNPTLPYPDGNSYTVSDLFSIVLPGGGALPPTVDGDSGAIVIDASDGSPLGMIIGGRDNYSYAMKFPNIFDPTKPYNGYTFII